MNTWILKDKIKRGLIDFTEGEEVVIFWRKVSGYPGLIKDGDIYKIKDIEGDHLLIHKQSSNGIGFLQPIRIHKTYMIPVRELREIKLNSLFDETK